MFDSWRLSWFVNPGLNPVAPRPAPRLPGDCNASSWASEAALAACSLPWRVVKVQVASATRTKKPLANGGLLVVSWGYIGAY